MKLALLGDTHFGIRNGSPLYHDFFDLVYGKWFFPLMETLGVKDILQHGDLYDVRKGVDSFSVSQSNRYFFDRLRAYKMHMTTFLGNHDVFFKDTLAVNSPELLLGEYADVVFIVNEPTTTMFDSTEVDLIPWICKANEAKVHKLFESTTSKYCFGHFELAGFAMYKGMESHGGMSPTLLNQYDHVFSGHFHTRSTEGNVTYIGTPCELTWNDYGDARGIHILDTDTGEVEFHECPFTLFEKVMYNEDAFPAPASFLAGKFVKIIVEKRTDFKKFDKYCKEVIEAGVHDMKVIEDLSDFHEENTDVGEIDVEDTPTLLNSYVDGIDTDLDKDRLKAVLHSLYVKAQELE